jgi:hypothetical protein
LESEIVTGASIVNSDDVLAYISSGFLTANQAANAGSHAKTRRS